MAKSVLYGAGVRVIVPREQKVRPWAHVLLGGIHMFPHHDHLYISHSSVL